MVYDAAERAYVSYDLPLVGDEGSAIQSHSSGRLPAGEGRVV